MFRFGHKKSLLINVIQQAFFLIGRHSLNFLVCENITFIPTGGGKFGHDRSFGAGLKPVQNIRL